MFVCMQSNFAEFRCLAFALLQLFLANTHTHSQSKHTHNIITTTTANIQQAVSQLASNAALVKFYMYTTTTTLVIATITTNFKAQAKLLFYFVFFSRIQNAY